MAPASFDIVGRSLSIMQPGFSFPDWGDGDRPGGICFELSAIPACDRNLLPVFWDRKGLVLGDCLQIIRFACPTTKIKGASLGFIGGLAIQGPDVHDREGKFYGFASPHTLVEFLGQID